MDEDQRWALVWFLFAVAAVCLVVVSIGSAIFGNWHQAIYLALLALVLIEAT